jgi:ThiF family
MQDRLKRNVEFFGEAGQHRLRQTNAVVVGNGGIGTHVIQQLALLGVGGIGLVDSEELDVTNGNRYVGTWHNDPVPGSLKVDLGARHIQLIDPEIRVEMVADSLITPRAFDLIKNADFVFGCLDCEGARLVLTELCAAYSRPYIDAASDIDPTPPMSYGGRVCCAIDGNGCLVCLEVLDIAEAQTDLGGPGAQRDREAIYGVDRAHLGRSGPSVVSINGVVASLAVTEFMLHVTGIREAHRLLVYRGQLGKVTVSGDQPRPDCYYCKGIRGMGAKADVERYLRAGVGQWLR